MSFLRPEAVAAVRRYAEPVLYAGLAGLCFWKGLTLAAASTDISANDSERSISYRMSLRPLLPDEEACPGEPAGEPTETETRETLDAFAEDNAHGAAARARIGTMLQVARVPEMLRVSEHINAFRSYYAHPLPCAELVSAAGLHGLERRLFGGLLGAFGVPGLPASRGRLRVWRRPRQTAIASTIISGRERPEQNVAIWSGEVCEEVRKRKTDIHCVDGTRLRKYIQ